MQYLIVSLIVAAAAGYAAWRLMPHSIRRWLIARLMVVAPSLSAWLARVEVSAENSVCGGCKGCAADVQISSASSKPCSSKFFRQPP